jgi:uncharacterized membrane protein
MKAKSWIVIGIIFFIFMTFNNLWIISGLFLFESEQILREMQILESRTGLPVSELMYSLWLIYAILHILSVYIIIKGVKKRRIENGITIDKSKNKVEERENSSLEILKKRYASGEISEEEFNKIKENLEKDERDERDQADRLSAWGPDYSDHLEDIEDDLERKHALDKKKLDAKWKEKYDEKKELD